MGTPSISIYNDIKFNLPGYNENFPKYQPIDLRKAIPQLDSDGINLLQRLLDFNPLRRINANDALMHVILYILTFTYLCIFSLISKFFKINDKVIQD